MQDGPWVSPVTGCSANCILCSPWCLRTGRTAYFRTAGENRCCLAIPPSIQDKGSSTIPELFHAGGGIGPLVNSTEF